MIRHASQGVTVRNFWLCGIFVSYDEIANEKRNFMLKVQKLNTNLDIWRSRKLSLFGRVLITKSLGIPHLIYSKSMLVTPSEVVSSVKEGELKRNSLSFF